MDSLPYSRGSLPRRHSQPAPLSLIPHATSVHDIRTGIDETLVEWHLSGVNPHFTTSSTSDAPRSQQPPLSEHAVPQSFGDGDQAGNGSWPGSRVRANSLFERPTETTLFVGPRGSPARRSLIPVPSRSASTTSESSSNAVLSIEPAHTSGSPDGILLPSSPVTPTAAHAGPLHGTSLDPDSPDSPLQPTGESSRKRRAPDPDSRRSRKAKRLKVHEEAFENATPLDRARFWDTAPLISDRTPLYGSIIRMFVDGESSSSRPLLFLTSSPLGILPPLGQSIVLDISPKLGRKSAEPCVQVHVTNAGQFDPLDDDQLALATYWVTETLRLHLHQTSLSDLRPKSWLFLPIKPGQGATDDAANLENTAINWEEVRLLDQGVSWPVADHMGSASRLAAFQDTVIRYSDKEPDRLVLVGKHERSEDIIERPSVAQATATGPPCTVITRVTPRTLQEAAADQRPLTADRLQEIGRRPQFLFLPASLFRSTSIIPAFRSALDDALLAHELSQNLFNGLIPFQACTTALTRFSAAPSYPERDYERSEFLGDTVARMLCDIDLWYGRSVHPGDESWRSSHFSELEDCQTNSNLLGLALERGIVPYIRSRPFCASRWRADIRSNNLAAPGETGQKTKLEPKVSLCCKTDALASCVSERHDG